MLFDYKDRPKLKLKRERLDYTLDAIAWIGWLLLILIPVLSYQELPEKVPTHFNGLGEADAWGSKSTLLTLPLVGSILFFGMFILNRYPHIYNYPVKITAENAEKQYRSASRLISMLNASVTFCFAYIAFSSIQNAKGEMDGLGAWFLPVVLLSVFIPIGYYLYISIKKK